MAYSFFREYGFGEIKGIEKQILYFWRGDFYRWERGIYEKLGKDELQARLIFHLNANGIETTTDVMNNVKMNLRSQAILKDYRVPDTWLFEKDKAKMKVPVEVLVTESGILTFARDGKVALQGITPDFFTLGKVPYEFDSKAICKRWLQFLDEVTGGDKELQRMLQQWAGYLLLPTQEYQAFMLLIGEAATGKGTFTRVMKGMLGKNNCSVVPLRRFSNNFALYLTYGKKLNVAGDAEEELTPQVEAIIKTWTGQDGLDFERKYADGFSAEPTAKLMISANSFPNFLDKSLGTWRRLKVVPFGRENTKVMDIELDSKLEKELPGILNWAIAGLQDLQAAGGFTVAAASQVEWDKQREEANPAAMFLDENYYWKPNIMGVKVLAVYAAYRKWCKVKGYIPMSDKTFGREIRRVFPRTRKNRLGTGTSRYYQYPGVWMKAGSELRDILEGKV